MTGPGEQDDLPNGGDAALAAEYVLGLMPESEVPGFEARLAEDADLERDVIAWTEYFAILADRVTEVAPPQAVKRRIESAAFGTEPGRDRRPFWQAILPYAAGGVLAAVVAWAAFTYGPLGPSGDRPLLVADIAVEDSELAIHAGWFDEAGELLVIREAGTVPQGADLELWVIAGDAPPVSLGLVPRDAGSDRVRYALPSAVASLLPDATLAVSQEPPGGSPTDAPTGPVLGTAPITRY